MSEYAMNSSFPSEWASKFSSIEQHRIFSKEIIDKLSALNTKYKNKGIALAVTGSLARLEASQNSDLDGYLIAETSDTHDKYSASFWSDAIKISSLRPPSKTGTFGADKKIIISDFIANIGGSEDTTEKLTQRVSLVLESKIFGDCEIRTKVCEQIVKRYIADGITNHQLGLFLLNDIIRFYRTMCVDFEYKTTEAGKSWGIRNIKLVYSRKLMYFSGVLMCAEMAQRSAEDKREICSEMMNLSPIERLISVLGKDTEKPLRYYNDFLQTISDSKNREKIEAVEPNLRSDSALFTKLKNQSHHFTWSLRKAFLNHYDESHPIHKNLLF